MCAQICTMKSNTEKVKTTRAIIWPFLPQFHDTCSQNTPKDEFPFSCLYGSYSWNLQERQTCYPYRRNLDIVEVNFSIFHLSAQNLDKQYLNRRTTVCKLGWGQASDDGKVTNFISSYSWWYNLQNSSSHPSQTSSKYKNIITHNSTKLSRTTRSIIVDQCKRLYITKGLILESNDFFGSLIWNREHAKVPT